MEVVFIVFMFTFLTVIMTITLSTRHKERRMIIERGLNPDEIKALYAQNIHLAPLSSMKWGIILLFVGVTLLLGNYLKYRYDVGDSVLIGMVLIAAGAGLLLFYAITPKEPPKA
jgi:hypothetical protein